MTGGPLTIRPEVLALYSQTVGCQNTIAQCPGIVRDLARGIPPRGFYTEAAPGEVQLLLVAKSPGHVIRGETGLYENGSPEDITRAHFAWARRCFFESESFDAESRRSLVFHRNILRYVSFFLDVPEAEVFRHCAYTNLVKCQTLGEQDLLAPSTMRECFSQHFTREVGHFGPRALIALGREPFEFLKRANGQLGGIPVLYVRHPSYHYANEKRDAVLAQLKNEVQVALGERGGGRADEVPQATVVERTSPPAISQQDDSPASENSGLERITVLTANNPRQGTWARLAFSLYRTGMTVAEWRAACLNAAPEHYGHMVGYLWPDVRAGYIKLD